MKRQVEAVIPSEWGVFSMVAYADTDDELMPHLALVHESFDPSRPVLLRIHSECMTGDTFASLRCDCGEQLATAMEMAAEQGGVVLYLRQEGRGIGLINKLKAYNLQDTGLNTLDANTHLGLEVDSRQYDVAVQMMEDLGIQKIRLLTNNPTKIEAIEESSVIVTERVPLVIPPKKENLAYLEAKQNLMGHLFRVK